MYLNGYVYRKGTQSHTVLYHCNAQRTIQKVVYSVWHHISWPTANQRPRATSELHAVTLQYPIRGLDDNYTSIERVPLSNNSVWMLIIHYFNSHLWLVTLYACLQVGRLSTTPIYKIKKKITLILMLKITLSRPHILCYTTVFHLMSLPNPFLCAHTERERERKGSFMKNCSLSITYLLWRHHPKLWSQKRGFCLHSLLLA